MFDPAFQAVTDLRTSGLNIMMSMKDQATVSFVEDCAAAGTSCRLHRAAVCGVRKHGTRGTFYAHASSAACMCARS